MTEFQNNDFIREIEGVNKRKYDREPAMYLYLEKVRNNKKYIKKYSYLFLFSNICVCFSKKSKFIKRLGCIK